MSDSWIVDAMEDGWVRLEAPDGAFVTIPRAWLPERVSEGMVLRVEPSGEGLERLVRLTIDEAASQRRRAAIGVLRDQLKRGPSGDLEL